MEGITMKIVVYAFTDLFSLLREWIDQVSTESVMGLGVSTKLSAWEQLNIDLTATSKLEKNSLSTTILWILTVILPGWGNQLTVLHQLQLLVEPLSCIAGFGISREGEEEEPSVGGCECTCEESGSAWILYIVGLLRLMLRSCFYMDELNKMHCIWS